jgi:predicted nucleotidyltransferase
MLKENKNLLQLQEVAVGLNELIDDVAFIGGCVAQLYADDSAASEVRPTLDVDCVVSLSARKSYYKLEEKLRGYGFRNDTTPGAPICRWLYNGIPVDIMPTDADILGFGNPWYEAGFEQRIAIALPGGLIVHLFPAELYLATKMSALLNRGGRDLRLSHDFEDIVFLLDNCSTLVNQIYSNTNDQLKLFLCSSFERLLQDANLHESIGCALPLNSENERLVFIVEQMRLIAQCYTTP